MGFQGRRFQLEWEEGHQLHGLEVTCRPLSTGEMIDIWALGQDASPAGRIAMARGYIDLLAGDEESERPPLIIDWNYETPDGQPIEATPANLRGTDWLIASGIVGQLVQHAGGVSDPLAENSSDGEQWADMGLSEATEYPSESPGSLNEPSAS